MNLQNTIIGENTAPSGRSCSGAIVSQDYNLVESREGCTLAGGSVANSIQAPALLADLADNGGPTRTHALEAGSPAIDMGQSDEAVDQRGYARDAGQDDIGAFEFGGSAPELLVASGEAAPAEDVVSAEVPEASSLKAMTEAVRLDPVAPNPLASGRAGTVTFAVRDAEAVEVTLYDVAGRRVQTLYSGTPLAGQAQTVAHRRERSRRWRLRRPPPGRDGAGDPARDARSLDPELPLGARLFPVKTGKGAGLSSFAGRGPRLRLRLWR